jgi:hypothetical protein
VTISWAAGLAFAGTSFLRTDRISPQLTFVFLAIYTGLFFLWPDTWYL